MKILYKRTLTSALALLVTIAPNLHAESASTVVWNGVLEGVGTEVTVESIGWALSALGVNTDSSTTEEFKTINSDLQEISSELITIEKELGQILTALDVQNCEIAADGTTLLDAIDNINNAYSNDSSTGYTDVVKTAKDSDLSQSNFNEIIFGVDPLPDDYEWENFPTGWIYRVLNDDGGSENPSVADAISNINTAITGDSGALTTCITNYSAGYIGNTDASGEYSQAGPRGHPIDDLGYYAGVQNIVGRYVSLQIQAAAMVSEAYHLLACQAAAADTSITSVTNCDFSTSSSTNIYEICNSGNSALNNSDVKDNCSLAESSVENAYSQIKDELVLAGAPYSWPAPNSNGDATRHIGIVYPAYGSSSECGDGDGKPACAVLMPQSLENFNNHASGGDFDRCENISNSNPLTSESAGCGFIAGKYDDDDYVNSDGNAVTVAYEGYSGWSADASDNDGGNVVWPTIFETFNKNLTLNCSDATNSACQQPSTGDSVLASGYMESIGFKNAANKILTMSKTTKSLGKNNFLNESAVCNTFTGVPFDKPGHVPFCTGLLDSGEATNMQHAPDCTSNCTNHAADGLENAIENTTSDTVVTYANGYYYFGDITCNLTTCSGGQDPGWVTDAADFSEFYQYRWPFLNLAEKITCTSIRDAGVVNPSGTFFTMCGDDLQAYLDAILPEPGTTVTQTLNASANTSVSTKASNIDRPLRTGHTVLVNTRISNFDSERRVDIYMGAIYPNGNTIAFVTGLDPLVLGGGTLDNPASYLPLVKGKRLKHGFLEYTPNAMRYTFTGAEDQKTYQFFTLLAKPDAFSDGIINAGDIISVDLDPFHFVASSL